MPDSRVIDFLTYVGQSPYGDYCLSPRDLIRAMDENQIEMAVIAPFTDTPGPDEQAHSRLLKACREAPGRLVPFARIDPRYGEKALDALQEAIQQGFRGLLFNPVSCDSLPYAPGVVGLMERAADWKLPVIIPAGQSYVALPEQIAWLAEKVPGLTVVIGQMGLSGHATRAITLLETHPNLYIETSIQQSPYRLPLLRKQILAGRVLFASSSPYSHPRVELLKCLLSGLSENELALLLGGNARRLLGLEVRS